MGARPRNLALGHLLHGEFLALLGAVEKIEIEQLLVRKAGPATVPEEKRDFSHSFEMTGGEERKRGREEERKRDFSLRRPTHSQERMRKKKLACSVRNDGGGVVGHKKSACSVRNDGWVARRATG